MPACFGLEGQSIPECRKLLAGTDLWTETGYAQTETGDWQVSMNCPMPGVTADKINW